MTLAIRGGLVLTSEGIVSADVLVAGDIIADIDERIESAGTIEIDARGCFVGPGLVDIHTHLREPGQTWKEDLESGSRAAASGGFTALVAMPNTEPPIDDSALVTDIISKGRSLGLIEIHVAGSLTRGRKGSEPSDLEGMYQAGARLFTDDGDCVEDTSLTEELMGLISGFPGAVFAQHAELTSLTRDGHINEGPLSRRLGIGGLPADAESRIVARDLDLVRRIGAPYHCQHVSAAPTVDLIRDAKLEGLPVTAEVTPHHLTFTESELEGLDPNFKMYPPLRGEQDRSALRAALLDGTIDVVATDHAPHTTAEQAVDFSRAPRGVIGLETAAAATWGTVSDPHRFFEVLSSQPARIAGIETQGHLPRTGGPANLVVFDPNVSWIPRSFLSKSTNSPYLGKEMTGGVKATIAAGDLVHRVGGERI